jgi:hypothetical protein
MKKTIKHLLFIAFLLALCVSFNSCGKVEDGVYNPKQKISKIYEDFTYDEITNKELIQEWTWEKNQLSKIDYCSSNPDDETQIIYSDRFFYNGNKLVKIEQNDGSNTQLFYDGSKLKNIEVYDRNQSKWLSMIFTYTNNKISKIIIEEEKYKNNAFGAMFLPFFFPNKFISKIAKCFEENGKKSDMLITYNVNYNYTGDNIKEMVVDIFEGESHLVLTANYLSHDNKQNPFYKKFTVPDDFVLSFVYVLGNNFVSSKNNPLEVVYQFGYAGGSYTENDTYKYTYSYDNKDFPTEILLTGYYGDDVNNSWIKKNYYEYEHK